MITQERLKELLHYDPETGIFTRLWCKYSPQLIGKEAGNVDSIGYISVSVDSKNYRAHRLAFLYMEGAMPPDQVDHINRIRTDNRWRNLRHSDYELNNRNQNLFSTNTSGITGVRRKLDKSKYCASIYRNKKNKTLYYGDDFFEACCARKSAEIRP